MFPEFVDLLDRQLVQFEIGDVVTCGEDPAVLETGRAHIDSDNLCLRVAQGVTDGLGSSTPCHQYRPDRFHRSVGPDQMMACPSVTGLRCSELGEGRRIGVTVVERLDRVGSNGGHGSIGIQALIIPAFNFSSTLSTLNDAGS
jgi:hypothetical protein